MAWSPSTGLGLAVVGGLTSSLAGCCSIWETMFENGMLCCVVCRCASYTVKSAVKYE